MHPLDNIIWQALNTRQAEFAESSGTARRFTPEVSPLAAFDATAGDRAGYESLKHLVPAEETIGLFLNDPCNPQPGWDVVATAPLLEMVYDVEKPSPEFCAADSQYVTLADADSSEMIALTSLTKPGPFHRRTHELGNFVGIRRDGKLVAMAGERLKVPGHTEVSAVCTHPDYLGRGYARLLMVEVMRGILARGENAFLHVRADNLRAIELYKKLGFRTRVNLQYVVLRKE